MHVTRPSQTLQGLAMTHSPARFATSTSRIFVALLYTFLLSQTSGCGGDIGDARNNTHATMGTDAGSSGGNTSTPDAEIDVTNTGGTHANPDAGTGGETPDGSNTDMHP